MSEREGVRLRQLPAGGFRHGFDAGFEGDLLHVEFASAGEAGEFPPGSTVEVEGARTIYLGEVYALEGTKLVIGVEHIVDRQALNAIQEVWSSPDRR